ncbi:hypothetical protein V8F06_008739 [Rhypophila decipiens]
MPVTEIITIVNNSGKIISTGKQLVGIFKEAQATYREKREEARIQRGIQRAKTFDVTPRTIHEIKEKSVYEDDRRTVRSGPGRRRSHDDGDDTRSSASSRYTHRSRRTHRPPSPDQPSRPMLTASNLKTHSEVSATSPSTAPKAYRSPYAESSPRDMQLSRPTLVHSATMPLPRPIPVPAPTPSSTPVTLTTSRSETSIPKKKKEIDMNLAYGDVPPDLAERHDLDPKHSEETGDATENQALGLIEKIESFLEEAHCVHHTANSMINKLQEKPEAAAAVALSLAELSTLLGKMSPAFLGLVKGGSPAIFALLSSPQFLIGTSVVAGIVVVMFGGWKIIKRIGEVNAAKALETPFEMQPMAAAAAPAAAPSAAPPTAFPAPPQTEASYDEALVLEEELSTIESWRRGISPYGEDEAADVELMSREAERALREQYYFEENEGADSLVDPDDSISRVGYKHHRRPKSHRSGHTHRSSGSRRHREEGDVEVPERKSSKAYHKEGSSSGRSHHSHRSHRDRGEGESEVAESVRSHRSHRSSRSTRTMKTIEDSPREEDGDGEGSFTMDVALRPKKANMLRMLFKRKKERDEKEKAGKESSKRSVVSVMV